jgi:hypothetical protein
MSATRYNKRGILASVLPENHIRAQSSAVVGSFTGECHRRQRSFTSLCGKLFEDFVYFVSEPLRADEPRLGRRILDHDSPLVPTRPLQAASRAPSHRRRRAPGSWRAHGRSRQAGSNAAQRILKALETESRPHAGTYIEASTIKRPTIKQTKPLVTSEAHGQPSA